MVSRVYVVAHRSSVQSLPSAAPIFAQYAKSSLRSKKGGSTCYSCSCNCKRYIDSSGNLSRLAAQECQRKSDIATTVACRNLIKCDIVIWKMNHSDSLSSTDPINIPRDFGIDQNRAKSVRS